MALFKIPGQSLEFKVPEEGEVFRGAGDYGTTLYRRTGNQIQTLSTIDTLIPETERTKYGNAGGQANYAKSLLTSQHGINYDALPEYNLGDIETAFRQIFGGDPRYYFTRSSDLAGFKPTTITPSGEVFTQTNRPDNPNSAVVSSNLRGTVRPGVALPAGVVPTGATGPGGAPINRLTPEAEREAAKNNIKTALDAIQKSLTTGEVTVGGKSYVLNPDGTISASTKTFPLGDAAPSPTTDISTLKNTGAGLTGADAITNFLMQVQNERKTFQDRLVGELDKQAATEAEIEKVNASARAGLVEAEGRVVPMEAIIGEQALIEKRANLLLDPLKAKLTASENRFKSISTTFGFTKDSQEIEFKLREMMAKPYLEADKRVKDFVSDLAKSYPDAGITFSDSAETASVKASTSPSFMLKQSETRSQINARLGGGELSPKQLSAALQLSNSLKSHPAYTDMLDIATGLQGVNIGLSQQNGFGDVTAINAFQRMVDPGATVRSEDVVLLQSASAWIQKVLSDYPIEKLTKGAKLPDPVREQMKRTAEQLYSIRSQNYNSSVGNQYRNLSRAAGVPFEMVGQDFPQATQYSPRAETPEQKSNALNSLINSPASSSIQLPSSQSTPATAAAGTGGWFKSFLGVFGIGK